MEIREALTLDDVLLVPAARSVLPSEADTSTFVTQSIRMNIPLLSSAMDTVTEARLAITVAQEGGIGIIHKNLTAQEQAAVLDLALELKQNRFAYKPFSGPQTVAVIFDKTSTRTGQFANRSRKFSKCCCANNVVGTRIAT